MPSSAGPGPDARNAANLEQRLREAGDPARAAAERAYLKSSMEFAGATVPGIRRIVRALLPRRPALPRDGLLDVIVTFVRWREDLEAQLPGLRRRMAPACGLWIAWPKRAARVPTDMTDHVVREVALPTGLVDNKVCAIDEI